MSDKAAERRCGINLGSTRTVYDYTRMPESVRDTDDEKQTTLNQW